MGTRERKEKREEEPKRIFFFFSLFEFLGVNWMFVVIERKGQRKRIARASGVWEGGKIIIGGVFGREKYCSFLFQNHSHHMFILSLFFIEKTPFFLLHS